MNGGDALTEIVVAPLGPAGLSALLLALSLYIILSSRLGAVTKMPPYYYWFLVGGSFTGLALGVSILRSAAYLSHRPEVAFLTSPEFGLFFFHIPLLVGVLINLAAAWRYWSWLVTGERR
jgi:hypothetical protein